NVIGTFNLLEAGKKAGIKQFIFSSSAAVYGDPASLPINETHPTRPISAYGLSKLTGELYCHQYRSDFKTSVFRFSKVYGPRQSSGSEGGIVAILIDRLLKGKKPIIYGNGQQTRDFIFVNDIVEAMILALSRPQSFTLNLGSNQSTKIITLLKTISRLMKVKPEFIKKPFRPMEIKHSLFDYSKAQKLYPGSRRQNSLPVYMKLLIILPAFNEAKVISQVLAEVKKATAKLAVQTEICVINDGSSDNTALVAKKANAAVLTHVINRGLGASLSTGLEYAQQIQADFAITMDSDGQHDPDDLITVLTPLLNQQADVVIGSRRLQPTGRMPLLRQLNNQAFNLLTRLLFGMVTTDSLSGFRGFGKRAIQLIKLKTERMEVSNEFFTEIKRHHLKFTEVPIKVIYTKYSLAKGVKPGNVFAIIFRLLLRLVR
ncbi:NAD-dependent epimerase/dehydratase family protein, partial [Microgenomates group bacterium]|nr:NAD-dependent epimerase/dehydratase family protein [Microgenomates group bacterium]